MSAAVVQETDVLLAPALRAYNAPKDAEAAESLEASREASVEDGDAEADAAAASGITGFEDALLPADRFWEVAMSVIDTVQYIPRSDARYSEALQQLLGDYKEAAIASVAAFYEDAVAAECKHARKGQPFVGGEFVAAYCSELGRKTAAIMELAQAIIEEETAALSTMDELVAMNRVAASRATELAAAVVDSAEATREIQAAAAEADAEAGKPVCADL